MGGVLFLPVVFLLLLLHCVSDGEGFNLEPKLPVIKRGDPSSYFGFSVAQHLTPGVNKPTPW